MGGGIFWLPDNVLIKNSLRGARRSAMNISGLLQNNKVGVWGRTHREEEGGHSPRCPARSRFAAVGRRGEAGHLHPLRAGASGSFLPRYKERNGSR